MSDLNISMSDLGVKSKGRCTINKRKFSASLDSVVVFSIHRLEKEYTTIKNKEMEEQIEIKVCICVCTYMH